MSSSNPAPKGGFLQGIPQVSALQVRSLATDGCCGSTDQSPNTGCCGEGGTLPVTASPQISQGCCGEPTAASTTAAQATGCCGEPVTTAGGVPETTPSGCCN